MTTHYLENRTGEHSKFYELWTGAYVDNETGNANSAFVGSRFGRIGTEGRTIFKEFGGQYCKNQADTFLRTKLHEKLFKGYEFKEVK